MVSSIEKSRITDQSVQDVHSLDEKKKSPPSKQQANCLVLYGIPEGKRTTQAVNDVLSLANLQKTDYCILHRVGKLREDGSCRPLKVGLSNRVRMPLLKELAVKLQSCPKLSSVIVSKYETKAAQYAGFLAREERRRLQRAETESRSSTSSSPVDVCCPLDIQKKIQRAAEELHLLMENVKLLKQEYEMFLPNCQSLSYHPTIIDNLIDFYSIVHTNNKTL